MNRSLLIVEDEPAVRSVLAAMLEKSDLRSEFAENAEEALAVLREREFDAVLSDVVMPGRSGIELVTEARRIRPETPVLLMTGYASVDSAVASLRAGALDYLMKPVKRKQMLAALARAFATRGAADPRPPLAPVPVGQPDLIAPSGAMREIVRLIDKIADADSNVLVTGESGTGKELVARAIHARGSRAQGPFVPVNCTAIPEGLLESELFGHVRGAFTGAVGSRSGLFEEADGGTLFLDEIGDMDPALQGKLLRALQEREIRRVGSSRATKVDVRIVSATHVDLRAQMETGRFRRDLFYRLNVIRIHVPPLRERPEDVRELARYFLRTRCPDRPVQIEDDALERLVAMRWEGNVRQLENTLECALALGSGDVIRAADLPTADCCEEPMDPPDEDPFQSIVEQRIPMREVETRMIEEALRATGGNKVQAARLLGISRRTLYRRNDPAS